MEESAEVRQLVARIRVAGPSDAAMLATLSARLFDQTYREANAPSDTQAHLSPHFTEPKQRAEIDDSQRMVWIAEDHEGVPVGYTVLRRGSTAAGVAGQRPAEVQRIYADQ